MSAALLLADGEPNGSALEQHLTAHGYDVLRVAASEEALDIAERARPDLVLVADELDVTDRLRQRDSRVPVIVLGREQAGAIDRVRAFARGCDDYVAQPFVYEELLWRIRAVLRRSARTEPETIQVAEIYVDRLTRCVTVAGRRISLAAREYELLLKLASEPTRVFTKEELLREVWGFRSLGRTRTLDSHASRLRRKLCADGEARYVLNVWGVGYRLLEPAQPSA